MAHFASESLPASFGCGASLTKANIAMQLVTGTGTEGTQKLTYVVPVAGMYQVSGFFSTTVASNAATSHTGAIFFTYNDGTAVGAAALQLTGVTQTATQDMMSTAGTIRAAAMSTIYAAAGSSIVVYMNEVVTGAQTAGKYNVAFRICGI